MEKFFRLLIYLTLTIVLSLAVISVSNSSFNPLKSPELSSPSNWIKEDQIKVYNDGVVLDILNPTWAKFTNTNSMDPFIDEDSNAIEILPNNPNDINAGDVISYRSSSGVIIHRVIEKGFDDLGIYYIVKGDNNSIRDPFKVRFNDVEGVVVAVIY